MKAAQITRYGDPSVVTINEIDKPTAAAGQVVVDVHSSSINPFDAKIRAGYMKDFIPLELPATLGGDIAGAVAEVGDGVTGFAVGDKVYGQANIVAGNSGAFAEFARTTAGEVAPMPASLDFDQAAALPLVGVSAWQGIVEHIRLTAGQTIFIIGGSGGIGGAAIQIAKHLGATVITTASGDGIAIAKKLGADQVIDYKSEDFTTIVKNVDVVLDTVGGDDFAKSLGVLKSGGIAVTLAARPDEAKAAELGVTALGQQTHVTSQALNALTELIEAGVVTPRVQKTFPLSEIAGAFSATDAGGIHGKVVIKIK